MKKRQKFLLSTFINRESTFLTAGKKILSNKNYWSPIYIFFLCARQTKWQHKLFKMATSEQFQNAVRLLSLTTLFLSFKDNNVMELCLPGPTFIRMPWGKKKADNGCYHEDPSIPYLMYPPIINVHCQITASSWPSYLCNRGLNQDDSTFTRERTSQYDTSKDTLSSQALKPSKSRFPSIFHPSLPGTDRSGFFP